MSDWTDERKAELMQRWAAGDSAEIIAGAMGVTRNAIIGKIHRLGLPGRKTTTRRPPVRVLPRKPVDWDERRRVILDVQANDGTYHDAALRIGASPDTIRKDAVRLGVPFAPLKNVPSGQRHTASLPRPPRVRTPPVARVRAPVPDDAVDILQVLDATAFRPGKCKWPVNDSATAGGHLFCGHHTSEGGVYCVCHNALAYVPVPGRQQIYASRR